MTAPSETGWAPIVPEGPAWSQATPDFRDAAKTAAVSVIDSLTGNVFGLHPLVLAPYVPVPLPSWNRYYDLGVSGLESGALGLPGCAGSAEVLLWGPVAQIDQVSLDGDPLPSSGWAQDGDVLRRLGGYGWPTQNVNDPTFLVSYQRGNRVPVTANVAAGLYAAELIKGMVGSSSCKLPATVREVSRAGTSISLADPAELIVNGQTGVAAVDQLIAALNPKRLQGMATIWTPELARHRLVA